MTLSSRYTIQINITKLSKAFDSIIRWKTEQIIRAYDFPKETATATMMVFKNMKTKTTLNVIHIHHK